MTRRATISCEEFLDRAAAVALDAGDAEDAALVDEHARRCSDCRARLAEFHATVAALGMGIPQIDPPQALQSRLADAVRREPRPIVRRLWPRAQRLRSRVSPAWVVAAASLVFSVMAFNRVVALQAQVDDLQRNAVAANERIARYQRVVQVLNSDTLAIRPLHAAVQTVATSGMVYMDPSSGTGMVMCHNLPPVEQGRAYQIWFVRGNERTSGGMLWPDQSGNAYAIIKVPEDLQSYESIGVTDEPGSGSRWPTTPRVIGTPLKESTN